MLTKKQKPVLDYIEKYSLKKGYAPSLEEIQKKFELASVSTAHFHVAKLRDAGYLDKVEHKARAISVPTSQVLIQPSLLETSPTADEKKKNIKNVATCNLPLNKIICGDAVEIMSHMPEGSVDLTVTSPPYDELRNYNGYRFNFEGMALGLFRVTKRGGIVVWVVGDKTKNGNRSLTSFRQALYFQQVGFNVHDVMIYKKKNTPFMRSNAYTSSYEFMFILSKGSPKSFNPLKTKTVRQGKEKLPHNKGADGVNKKILKELKPEKTLTNIWEYAVGLGGSTSDRIAFKHPAIFPEKLAEDHILSWTNKKDIVFDPMCGSGTTCKTARKHGRAYIGCDISKEYVELAKKRLQTSKL